MAAELRPDGVQPDFRRHTDSKSDDVLGYSGLPIRRPLISSVTCECHLRTGGTFRGGEIPHTWIKNVFPGLVPGIHSIGLLWRSRVADPGDKRRDDRRRARPALAGLLGVDRFAGG